MFLKPKTYNLKPDPRGFTLVEIIVVVGITALLAAILIGYSQRSRQQIILSVEKARISQTILESKSLALAGFTKPTSNPPPCSYGFRVNYSNEVYSLFEYKPPPPLTCDDILSIPNIDNTNPAYFRETASSTLDSRTDFTIENDSLGYIIFIPPDLKTLVFDKDGLLFTSPMTIYLKTKDGSLSTKITVNHATGQLSF